MQKNKSPRTTTYTLEASSSQSSHRQHNNQDQTTTTSSTAHTLPSGTPRDKAGPLDTHQPIEEQEDHISGLDTSGANSTIHEYINMLSVNDPSPNHTKQESSASPNKRYSSTSTKKKQNSLELKFTTHEHFPNTITLQHSVSTRAKKESPDTLKDLKNLIKTPEPKKAFADLVTIREKGKELLRTGPPLKSKVGSSKSLSKQSISKLATTPFLQNQKSAVVLGSSIARRLPTEISSYNGKEAKVVNVIARLPTSPNDDRDIVYEIATKPNSTRHVTLLSSPTISDGKRKKTLENTSSFVPDKYQVTMRCRNSSVESPDQTLRSTQKQVSVSRVVKALVTSRTDLGSGQKGIPISPKQPQHEANRLSLSKDVPLPETRASKEGKLMKAIKVDVVEVNLPGKSGKKKKEQKVDECIEKLDEIYEKLRKTITEKKNDIAQNDLHIKALENLNVYLSGTQNLFQASKST